MFSLIIRLGKYFADYGFGILGVWYLSQVPHLAALLLGNSKQVALVILEILYFAIFKGQGEHI